ncbi:MAG: pseudouridine synthase [Cyanobacteria bacterium P01_H01_bin.121]
MPSAPPTYRYIIFNKPYDVLCQFTGEKNQRTLKHYIDVPEVYPVGRLDRDSEGLVFLTNHGHIQHRLSHPRFAHPRTYWVQVERIPTATALLQLQAGVLIKGGYQTQPAQVKRLPASLRIPPRDPPIRDRKTVPTAWLSITLTEGRNRQVRRMTAAVGFPTLRLIRINMGIARPFSQRQIKIDSLPSGQWRYLTPTEQAWLTNL